MDDSHRRLDSRLLQRRGARQGVVGVAGLSYEGRQGAVYLNLLEIQLAPLLGPNSRQKKSMLSHKTALIMAMYVCVPTLAII